MLQLFTLSLGKHLINLAGLENKCSFKNLNIEKKVHFFISVQKLKLTHQIDLLQIKLQKTFIH